MSQLRIRFRGLALFVNRPNGLTVYFPQVGHQIKVTIGGQPLPTPAGDTVVLRRTNEATPYNEPTLRASVPLLHLDSISNERLKLRDGDLAMPRWELGGGKLIALRAKAYDGYEYWSDYTWSFGEHWEQPLTDTVDFVLDHAADFTLESSHTGESLIPPQVWKENPRRLEVEVHNEDLPLAQFGDDEAPFELAEMRTLYTLFGDVDGAASKKLPLPRATAEAYAYFKRNKDNWTEPGALNPVCEKPFCPGMQAEGDPR